MSKKTILVTGNMGYVGSILIHQLRNSDPDVTIIGFDTGYFASSLTGDVLPECRINKQIFGDIRHFPEEILEGVDAIIHLAAISNDPIGNKFENITMDVNFHASVELARKAKNSGVKSFVFASSCSVYGIAEDGARTEHSSVNPQTAYARSKVQTESALRPLAGDTFTITCLRFATACGWSPRIRLDLVLNDFVASAVIHNQITILSDGSPWRPIIDVKDMSRAMEWALTREPHTGGPFLIVNIGSDHWNFQVKELAEQVAGEIPGIRISVNQHAVSDSRSYKVSFEHFKSLAPDYQPRQNLLETIRELKQGIENIPNYKSLDIRNSNFIRLKVLEQLSKNQRLTSNLGWK